ncbi:MAG: hypothetical protein IT440_11800 [Phycisphaeraceae bacterium]|nr:hypothetical protein [Phycisphaeraceae bacterium]
MNQASVHVIKLGGSLLDVVDLPARLTEYLDQEAGPCGLLVVGGGEAANVARRWDSFHHVGQETGHHLAVRAMRFNMRLLETILPQADVVASPEEALAAWKRGQLALVDPVNWLAQEEALGVKIPRRWSFTSDSIAAHLALMVQAGTLTLLKSTLPKGECGLADAADLGLVDVEFPRVAVAIPHVELVNLRQQPATRCRLQ